MEADGNSVTGFPARLCGGSMDGKGEIQVKIRAASIIFSFCLMEAAAGILWACGFDGVLYYNKGLMSLGIFLLGILMFPKACRHWKADRRRFLIGYLMSSLLVFTELLGTWMRRTETVGSTASGGFLWLFSAVWLVALLLEPCFYAVIGWTMGPERESGQELWLNRLFFGAWGILAAAYLPCLLAFYPGLYCYDMIWQWDQYASGIYSTHHPLIHTWLAGWVIESGKNLFGSYQKGLFLHSLCQLLIMSGSMAFALRFLAKRKICQKARAAVWLFFLLFPFFPVLGISTTKDTVFGCLYLIVFVCVCDMVTVRRFYRGRKLAAFVAATVLMCLFRNNAIYGLGVLFFCFLLIVLAEIIRRRDWCVWGLKAAGLTAVCVLLSQFCFAGLKMGFHAEKGSRAEMLSLPMQQMARAYVRNLREFSEEDREELLEYFDESMLLKYKYYVSDPVKAGIHMDQVTADPAGFVRLWLRLGRLYPAEYVESPLLNNFGLWYLGGDSSCYMEYDMLPPFDEAHRVELRSKMPRVKSYYSWFTDWNLQTRLPGISIFFYTSFYSWCVILSAGILWAKREYGRLLLPLFLACYEFTLLFGPCVIPRYCLGVMLCVPVLLVMTFSIPEGRAGSREL